jgi:hypothetical protein
MKGPEGVNLVRGQGQRKSGAYPKGVLDLPANKRKIRGREMRAYVIAKGRIRSSTCCWGVRAICRPERETGLGQSAKRFDPAWPTLPR